MGAIRRNRRQGRRAAGHGAGAGTHATQHRLAPRHQWAERERIWRRILEIHAEQVFTIGIVNSTLQPVVVNNRLRNVPAEGIYAWNPGAYFGIYKPDTFWFAANTKER